MSLRVFFFFFFSLLEEFEKDQYKFFLCLVEFTCEAIWPWTFVCKEFVVVVVFISESNLLLVISLLKLSVCS